MQNNSPARRGREGTIINGNKITDLTFARRLDLLMVERGLYPGDVQRLTGIRRQRIYEYVQGTVQPSVYNLKRLAEGLGVSADWLIGVKDVTKSYSKNM